MKDSRLKGMVLTAVMAAVICVLSPFSIPIGPVPVSLTNFAIFITLYVLGTKRGTLSVLIYLMIGLAGLPVFSGFQGGPGKLFGPTGGYLIGYIPMALIAGAVIEKSGRKAVRSVLGMILSTAVLYAIGTPWLAWQAHMPFGAALSAGVIPFIAEDLIKMVIAALIGPVLYQALSKAGLIGRAEPAGT